PKTGSLSSLNQLATASKTGPWRRGPLYASNMNGMAAPPPQLREQRASNRPRGSEIPSTPHVRREASIGVEAEQTRRAGADSAEPEEPVRRPPGSFPPALERRADPHQEHTDRRERDPFREPCCGRSEHVDRQ